jgi:hypothetical protein
MKRIKLIVLIIFVFSLSKNMQGQDNLKLFYKDIKGVKKIEFFGLYGQESIGGGLSYLRILDKKNQLRLGVLYDQYEWTDIESKKKYEILGGYGKHIYDLGSNVSLRLFVDLNLGWEERNQLQLNKYRNMFFIGLDGGVEFEIHLVQRISLAIRGKQYVQLMDGGWRFLAQAEAGIRIVIN